MDWFREDPFESILKEFFGEDPRTRNYRERVLGSEQDERGIDYSEDEDNVYFIFELPGYNESDVDVEIGGSGIRVRAAKKADTEDVQSYLSQKLQRGIVITKKLPEFIKTKKFSQTMKNGVLEVKFKKK